MSSWPIRPLTGLLENAAAEKRRWQPRVAALHGPRPQARDESGRWTGFDSDERTPAPVKGPPDGEHNAWCSTALSRPRRRLRRPLRGQVAAAAVDDEVGERRAAVALVRRGGRTWWTWSGTPA